MIKKNNNRIYAMTSSCQKVTNSDTYGDTRQPHAWNRGNEHVSLPSVT